MVIDLERVSSITLRNIRYHGLKGVPMNHRGRHVGDETGEGKSQACSVPDSPLSFFSANTSGICNFPSSSEYTHTNAPLLPSAIEGIPQDSSDFISFSESEGAASENEYPTQFDLEEYCRQSSASWRPCSSGIFEEVSSCTRFSDEGDSEDCESLKDGFSKMEPALKLPQADTRGMFRKMDIQSLTLLPNIRESPSREGVGVSVAFLADPFPSNDGSCRANEISEQNSASVVSSWSRASVTEHFPEAFSTRKKASSVPAESRCNLPLNRVSTNADSLEPHEHVIKSSVVRMPGIFSSETTRCSARFNSPCYTLISKFYQAQNQPINTGRLSWQESMCYGSHRYCLMDRRLLKYYQQVIANFEAKWAKIDLLKFSKSSLVRSRSFTASDTSPQDDSLDDLRNLNISYLISGFKAGKRVVIPEEIWLHYMNEMISGRGGGLPNVSGSKRGATAESAGYSGRVSSSLQKGVCPSKVPSSMAKGFSKPIACSLSDCVYEALAYGQGSFNRFDMLPKDAVEESVAPPSSAPFEDVNTHGDRGPAQLNASNPPSSSCNGIYKGKKRKTTIYLLCGGKDMTALEWLPFISGFLEYSIYCGIRKKMRTVDKRHFSGSSSPRETSDEEGGYSLLSGTLNSSWGVQHTETTHTGGSSKGGANEGSNASSTPLIIFESQAIFVLVEYPGNGCNVDMPSVETLTDAALESLRKAIAFIPEDEDIELRTFGYSLGAAVALKVTEYIAKLQNDRFMKNFISLMVNDREEDDEVGKYPFSAPSCCDSRCLASQPYNPSFSHEEAQNFSPTASVRASLAAERRINIRRNGTSEAGKLDRRSLISQRRLSSPLTKLNGCMSAWRPSSLIFNGSVNYLAGAHASDGKPPSLPSLETKMESPTNKRKNMRLPRSEYSPLPHEGDSSMPCKSSVLSNAVKERLIESLRKPAFSRITFLRQLVLLAPFTSASEVATLFARVPIVMREAALAVISMIQHSSTKWDNINTLKELFTMFDQNPACFAGFSLHIFHGSKDHIIPISMGQRLYNLATKFAVTHEHDLSIDIPNVLCEGPEMVEENQKMATSSRHVLPFCRGKGMVGLRGARLLESSKSSDPTANASCGKESSKYPWNEGSDNVCEVRKVSQNNPLPVSFHRNSARRASLCPLCETGVFAEFVVFSDGNHKSMWSSQSEKTAIFATLLDEAQLDIIDLQNE